MLGKGANDKQRVIWSLVDLSRVAELLAKLPRDPVADVENAGELNWGGTDLELDSLIWAIEANCDGWWTTQDGIGRPGCGFSYAELPVCGAHQLLLSQDSLDHLLNVLRNRQFYAASEVTQERTLVTV